MDGRLNVFENQQVMKVAKHMVALNRTIGESTLPAATQRLVKHVPLHPRAGELGKLPQKIRP